MGTKKKVQHVYLVGAKSLGAYGGYETFVYIFVVATDKISNRNWLAFPETAECVGQLGLFFFR